MYKRSSSCIPHPALSSRHRQEEGETMGCNAGRSASRTYNRIYRCPIAAFGLYINPQGKANSYFKTSYCGVTHYAEKGV